MNKIFIPVLLVFIIVSLACNLGSTPKVMDTPSAAATPTTNTGSAQDSPSTPVEPMPTVVQSQGISAEYPASESVQIKWEPITGAEKYLLELQVGDAYAPIAYLPVSQTSYLDESVPADTPFTYRLSSYANAHKGESKTITIETQPVQGDPIQVGIEYDVSAPALVIDPTTIDPSTLDPNNFDPASLMPQPIVAEGVIGPQGGELSATGTNGVVYTLVVPTGALPMDVTLRLKPISAISDLPLSGGMMAAVLIEPASLVFDIPAQLIMTPPADFAPPAAPLLMAFAFDELGQEFHLYPFAPGATTGMVSQKIASLAFVPHIFPPLSEIAKIRDGGVYGEGSGTVEDVKTIKTKPPAKSQNRTAQRLATNQLDELTPLTPIEDTPAPLLSGKEYEIAKMAQSLQEKAGKANDWAKFMEVMEDIRTFLDAQGENYSAVQTSKFFEILAAKAKALLDKNKGDCLTFEDFMAQDLVERLINPKDPFSQRLSTQYITKYGQNLLTDLILGDKNCKFELSLNSKMTFTAAGSTLTMTAAAPKVPLKLTYSKGDLYLWGGGPANLTDHVSGICNYPLNHYPTLTFNVVMLRPTFENGVLVDFRLRYYKMDGWTKAVSVKSMEDKRGCPVYVNLTGGGDAWTGLFTITRMDDPIIGWQLNNSLNKGGSLTATWKSVIPSYVPMGVSESHASEDTTIVLTITKTKK